MAEKKKVSPVAAPAGDKKKALETAIAKIEKDYGKGTIMRLGDDISVNVEALSTGSLSLDLALGIGGVPRGRIVEIYGPEASGKTTLALHVVASAQKAGGEAAYIDVEHALEPAYARALGVDIDSLLISQPDTGEQALDIAESLVRSGAIDVLVVDSVAALIPRSELEGEVGDTVVGALARLMSQAMRRLAGAISKNNCTVIFINQLRQKIGVMYGNPETTPGGLALKYYASVRIDVRRIETLKVNGEMIGIPRGRDHRPGRQARDHRQGRRVVHGQRPALPGPRRGEGVPDERRGGARQDRGRDPRQRPQAHEPAGPQGRAGLRPHRPRPGGGRVRGGL